MPIYVSSTHFALRYEVPKFLPRGGHLCMAMLTIAVPPTLDAVWAGGVSRWTPSLGDLIIPFILSLISYTTYSNCTAIYCTILLFEYALITIGETASFFQGLLKGLSVGSSCSHVALSCLYSYRCAASSPVASTDTCTACTGI